MRVVSFGEDTSEEHAVSMELCGGTHVDSTAEIGSFRIVSESSVAAGIRRIEAVTGRGAEELIEDRMALLDRSAARLHTKPADLEGALAQLQEENQQLQKELAQLRQKLAQQETQSLLNQAVQVDGFSVLSTPVNVTDVETLRQMSDWFRDRLGSSVVVVGSVINEKPMLIAAVTPDLINRGMHAGNLVRDIAKIIGGSGGGRPNMAQAGGKDSDKLPAALEQVSGWVKQNLK